jgi:hypothetical protein
MGITVVPPHQLVPSLGIQRAGVMASAALTFTIYDSSVPEESIRFGSLTFMPHSPARRSAFSSFHEGIDLALGDPRFHASTVGTLCLPDPIRLAPGESTSSSTAMVSPAPSSIGYSGKLVFTPTLIYCVDCDARHITSLSDLIIDHDDGFTNNGSSSSILDALLVRSYRTHRRSRRR